MPVFNAHIPADRFSIEQKRALADALNQSPGSEARHAHALKS